LTLLPVNFFADGLYDLKMEGKKLTNKELVAKYQAWVEKYPIVSMKMVYLKMIGMVLPCCKLLLVVKFR
jgi:hypothetical protein